MLTRSLVVALGLVTACQTADVTFTKVDASVDAGSSIQSCQGLPANCGPNNNDSCCNSPIVTGGTYYRSYDAAGDMNSGTRSYPATISSFRLDKYEVTVGRFRAFVMAGKGTRASPPGSGEGAHAQIAGSGWNPSWNASLMMDKAAFVAGLKCSTDQTWTDAPGPNEVRPINCITWYEAMAFCAWDSGYLPTEAEWNYAATGGDQQRAYPWSNPPGSLVIDATKANYDDTRGVVQVGATPMGDGRWGQSDLAGNVWEWNLDWYESPYGTPCNDCAPVSSGTSRVTRSGSFHTDVTDLRAGHRDFSPPADRSGVGVRCARAP